MDKKTIVFEEKNVLKYIDDSIRSWRKSHKLGVRMAKYYVDAYQSMRTSLFGELLPEDKE